MHKTIQIDPDLLLSPHWKMSKQSDVPNFIQMGVFIQLVPTQRHSEYANIHHCPKSGNVLKSYTQHQTQITWKFGFKLEAQRMQTEASNLEFLTFFFL